MKLLLVIDVADDVAKNYKALTVNYDLRGDYGEWDESIKYVEDTKPRPLPQKWKGELSSLHPLAIHAQGMRDGYNMCLDEITGETE